MLRPYDAARSSHPLPQFPSLRHAVCPFPGPAPLFRCLQPARTASSGLDLPSTISLGGSQLFVSSMWPCCLHMFTNVSIIHPNKIITGVGLAFRNPDRQQEVGCSRASLTGTVSLAGTSNPGRSIRAHRSRSGPGRGPGHGPPRRDAPRGCRGCRFRSRIWRGTARTGF